MQKKRYFPNDRIFEFELLLFSRFKVSGSGQLVADVRSGGRVVQSDNIKFPGKGSITWSSGIMRPILIYPS